MRPRKPLPTARCEDCGTRVQTALGTDPRYPQGVATGSDLSGYICGECMSNRHEPAPRYKPRMGNRAERRAGGKA